MIDNKGSKATKKKQDITIKRFVFNNQINTH